MKVIYIGKENKFMIKQLELTKIKSAFQINIFMGKMIKKQEDRQCTYNVKLRRVYETIVAVEKQ